jgi:type IV secretion system protein VirD4
MLYQLIGQMREAYSGRDATSKWFESGVRDLVLGDQRSRDSGLYLEALQRHDRGGRSVSQSSQMSSSSRTRSKQLARRPLIMPHEAAHATDEQIIFHGQQSAAAMRPRHLVPTRRHAG